jgi:cyclophilin family peptidyl-prolyl cis-trans isomerase/HEAT repeat protein
MKFSRAALVTGVLFCCFQAVSAQQPAEALRRYAREWEQMAAAEDARARTPEQLNTLLRAAHSAEPELRRLAVRALGRLERAELSDTIAQALRDPAPRVRVEAAHALGQALSRSAAGNGPSLLMQALDGEPDPTVIAAIVETLGRLRYASPTEASPAMTVIVSRASGPAALGAVRGLYFLARQQQARAAMTIARATLTQLATQVPAVSTVEAIRTRTVAAATLVTLNADTAVLRAIIADREPFVRREAVVGLVAMTDTAAGAPLIMNALSDASGVVRYEALRAYRRLAATRGCDPIVNATRDTHAHTALLALDMLTALCRGDNRITELLDSIARGLPAGADARWHPAAHALVALAVRAPARAADRLPAFASHANPFVRTYAATAATRLNQGAVLQRLAADSEANVRAAAVDGLSRVVGHVADSVYIAQLTRDENQVLMAAVGALDSTRHSAAVPQLFAALDRVTALRRETSRDGRDTMLVLLRKLGNASLVDRMRPYLRDFDPQIAARAADALEAWTGSRPPIAPSAPPALQRVTFAEASALTRTRVTIQLATGGEVELEFFPFAAPTNAARFVRLARRGYFDGLTLHRVAPNFVVQGGSPSANEYMGDAAFTRDELALENWRGTVGLSTRGRDTGDGQLYINLIDNVRLDHDYTIFARVVRGMDQVDALLEGAVMRKLVVN